MVVVVVVMVLVVGVSLEKVIKWHGKKEVRLFSLHQQERPTESLCSSSDFTANF